MCDLSRENVPYGLPFWNGEPFVSCSSAVRMGWDAVRTAWAIRSKTIRSRSNELSVPKKLGAVWVVLFVTPLTLSLNPFTPMSDQDRISPYSINTIFSRLVTRIKKNIRLEIVDWSKTKFPELTSWEGYMAGDEENYSWDLGSEGLIQVDCFYRLTCKWLAWCLWVFFVLTDQRRKIICNALRALQNTDARR